MTDKELLELAAKAAGIEGHWVGGDFNTFFRTYNGYQMGWWNPLTDDGDALRLAMKLNLLDLRKLHVGQTSIEEYASDPCGCARRAIVRAAAEIVKEMK